jgi:tetratricopeptide (TPR) repeat protein
MKKSRCFILVIMSLCEAHICALYAQQGADALLAYRNGNYNEAIAICEREIAQNSSNVESYVVISWSLVRQARYEDALKYALAGRALNRYDGRITEVLGEVSYHQGKNVEALQYFQDYINAMPEGQRIDVAYYYTGEINIRLGRFRYADIALSTAIYYQPENAAWWTRLAYARERAGELRQAAAAYERAIALNAGIADARRGLERVREAMRPR